MEHFFAYTSRMRFISRWALMRNSQPENIQEHSHQVAVLAHALAVIRNRCFGGRVDPGTVAVAARRQRDPHRGSAYPHQVLQSRHPGCLQAGGAHRLRQAGRDAAAGAAAGLCRGPDPHRPGGGGVGEGGGQAVRPHQMSGGAKGRESGVPPGGGADGAGAG